MLPGSDSPATLATFGISFMKPRRHFSATRSTRVELWRAGGHLHRHPLADKTHRYMCAHRRTASSTLWVPPGSDTPAELVGPGPYTITPYRISATRSGRLELQRAGDNLRRYALAHNRTTRRTCSPAVARAVAHLGCSRALALWLSWRRSALALWNRDVAPCKCNPFGTIRVAT